MNTAMPDYRLDTPKQPKRCYTLHLNVGGDTWEDVIRSLREATDHIEEHGKECRMASGGVSAGYSVVVENRPEMTSARYFEELDAWQEYQRANGGEA